MCVLRPAIKLPLLFGFCILYVNELGLSFSTVRGLSVRVPVCPLCHIPLQRDEPPALPSMPFIAQ